ncbi:MAG: hypothetical protein M1830_003230 [Pleopsidium flavum]|nr:MAG: hypothetical protein M1830_003230 [Pleopsidium flavum]
MDTILEDGATLVCPYLIAQLSSYVAEVRFNQLHEGDPSRETAWRIAVEGWATAGWYDVLQDEEADQERAGSQPQKGITTYALSGNRQRPLAGVMTAAIFNTWRRFRAQVLYVAPPLAIAYLTLTWATEKNEYYNSKKGIQEMGMAEE